MFGLHRRTFLKAAVCAPLCAAPKPAVLKTSLNAYSFNKALSDGVTLSQVVEFAAKCKFEGIDPTAYYFPGYPAVPPDGYIEGLKRHAADLGIGISGTGVRNNFTTADEAIRKQGVNLIKDYVEVAAHLGAPVLRVFADTTQMRGENWQSVSKGATRQQVQEWIAADLKECAAHGRKFGVKIGVQNHGDFLKTGRQQLDLIEAAGSGFCGPIADIGSYKTADPYADIALVAPHAINWQVKQGPLGDAGQVPLDLPRLLRIIRKSGYTGYLPIETLSLPGQPYDPFTLVPAFLKQLQDAIAQTA